MLRACAIAWPIMFAILPLANFFLRRGWNTAFWVVAPVGTIGGSGVSMAFSECFSVFLVLFENGS